MKRWASILFWSVISAAFIGPGTVTTAASAGASSQYQLVWALIFSIIACWVLQDAAARLPLVQGKNLGETIADRCRSYPWVGHLVVLAIVSGGVAYQAGNILGGVRGAALLLDLNPNWLTIFIGIAATGILWLGNERLIAQSMGLVVAIMGVAFLWIALSGEIDSTDLITGSVIPSIPPNSELLVLGLIGTTIVPYNLFLASGIRHDQDKKTLRWGLGMAILIGGLISLAILLVGTHIQGEFSFEALAEQMQNELGVWGRTLFGLGLFAAGFSSSITAPLAAAITARSIWGYHRQQWHSQSRNFRLVWGIVMLTGLIFGLSGIKPIPAIILAQALNGLLLPFVAILLFLVINQKNKENRPGNTLLHNVLMLIVIGITIILGYISLSKALTSVL